MQQPKLALPAFSTMSQVSSVLEALWNSCTSAKKWLPSVRHCSKSSAHSASASSCVPCTGAEITSCELLMVVVVVVVVVVLLLLPPRQSSVVD